MGMHWVKLGLCAGLSGWILLFLHVVRSHSAKKWLTAGILSGVIFRITGAILVYTLWPSLNHSSDPVRAYIVQARQVLAGMVPYRDFPSSYSFFFAPVLAVPVFIWDSVGGIALFMSTLEIAGMWVYLRRSDGVPCERDLMTVFAWAWFPAHFYWLSLAGYNSGMIAAGLMAAAAMAHKRKDVVAGTFSAATFLATKLLALLFWPAVLFWDFDRKGIIKRAIPHVAAVFLLVGLVLAGADPLVPVRLEFGKATSGTLWFYWWLLGKEFRESPIYVYGPVVLFGVAFLCLFKRYRERVARQGPSFDASAAFIACTGVLFMLVSRKAYSFYLPMFLPFLLHVVMSLQSKMRELLPIAFLGTVTTLEPYLWVQVRSADSPWSDPRLWVLAVVDTAVIGSYLTLGKMCWKSLGGGAECSLERHAAEAVGRAASWQP